MTGPSLMSHAPRVERGHSPRSLKGFSHSKDQYVSVVRKELVALTGNHFRALVLNQLLYWTQRVKDLDLFLEEEKTHRSYFQRKNRHSDFSELPQYGWIYKTANDLIRETLLCVDRTTMRRYLNYLIAKGWVEERTNPSNKWDKTTQYRVNLRKIQGDFLALSLNLPECCLKEILQKLGPSEATENPNGQNAPSQVQNTLSNGQDSSLHSFLENSPKEASQEDTLLKAAENSNGQNTPSKVQDAHSEEQNALSKVQNARSYTYTEITTENTNREHTQCARNFQSEIKEEFCENALALWKTHVGQEVYPTRGRKQQLKVILSSYFKNDLSQWEHFCKRIKSSPFLMGEGTRKWRVTLDWVLIENNLLKVLEGNFDNPNLHEEQKDKGFEEAREKKFQEILDSIEDPVWRHWCSQLAFPPNGVLSKSSLSIFELESISEAKFLETEGNKLVWIGSSDPEVLGRIEDMRLEILSIVQRTFPNARNIRTRLQKSEPKHQERTETSSPDFPDQCTLITTNILNKGETHAQ